MGIWASFVTYVRLPLNFPGEVGEMAKKWSKNDPLVVGRWVVWEWVKLN